MAITFPSKVNPFSSSNSKKPIPTPHYNSLFNTMAPIDSPYAPWGRIESAFINRMILKLKILGVVYELAGLTRPRLPLLPNYTVLSDPRLFEMRFDPCWYVGEWSIYTPQSIKSIREAETAVLATLLEYVEDQMY
jgi:hypothetical protein